MPTDRRQVSGHYAGAVTRLLAHAVDIAISWVLLLVGLAAIDYTLATILRIDTSDPSGLWRVVLGPVWFFLYWWVSIAVAGKTPGKALLGLRVLRRDGTVLSGSRAAVRALALPLSYLLFGIGFSGILLGRERRALHDVIASSTVVYDWGERAAELPTPISAFLDRQSAERISD
jgi:uncharacterized RDD family membrane protein YckC